MDYKLSIKVDGKYTNVGKFTEKNKFGNPSLGLKVTPELAALILNTENGKWVNLYAFEDKGDRKPVNKEMDF